MNPTVITRFAPSPTGFMHVGGVRTALYAWLFARKNGGRFILRIEDTDKEREVAGAIPHIIESLKWLGIEWDEGVDKGGPHAPYLQSERLELYKKYATKLVENGHAYPDPYTEMELEALRKKAEEEKQPFLFRNYIPETLEKWDGKKALRFRAPRIARYEWQDLARGKLSAGEEAIDDFILMKNDGYPTYNFAHVIDDIEMHVTHVMRGEEFISSTPKFLSLYEALGVTPPAFVTMPVILGPDGKKKLSKRDGAKDILDYRAEGYLPEAMMNFLALLGWNPGTEQEFFSKDELMAAFGLDRIQPSGAHFNETKLLSVNQHWMRKLSDADFILNLHLENSNFGFQDFVNPSSDEGFTKSQTLTKIIPLLKERAKTFNEAREMLHQEFSCFFNQPTLNKELLTSKELPENAGATLHALKAFSEAIQISPVFPEQDNIVQHTNILENVSMNIKEILMPIADAEEKKYKGGRGAMLWPLRYALSGQERSSDPFTLISILGKEESLLRIKRAIAFIS